MTEFPQICLSQKHEEAAGHLSSALPWLQAKDSASVLSHSHQARAQQLTQARGLRSSGATQQPTVTVIPKSYPQKAAPPGWYLQGLTA